MGGGGGGRITLCLALLAPLGGEIGARLSDVPMQGMKEVSGGGGGRLVSSLAGLTKPVGVYVWVCKCQSQAMPEIFLFFQ